MDIFNVVRENLFTHEVTFKPFLSEAAARGNLRESWEKAAKEYRSRTGHSLPETECYCGERSAILICRGLKPMPSGAVYIENAYVWQIKKDEIPVQVAIQVNDGMVEAVYANANLEVETFDLDSTEFSEEMGEPMCDYTKRKLEKMTRQPDWKKIL